MNPADLANHVVALTQKVDALAQTVQNLQAENQALQDLVALTPNLPRLPPEPKVNPPPLFSSDRMTYREFINACKLMFELCPRTIPNDRIVTVSV